MAASETDPSSDASTYVYLDFSDKLTPSIFNNKVFLRIANLDKPSPLVQVNDLLFKGTHDECIGTNLFFEEIEDPPPRTNIFEKETPIRLRPVVAQTKLITLKPVKLPRKESTDRHEPIALNLNHEYQVVLDKLETGILNLDDLVLRDAAPQSDDHFDDVQFEPRAETSTEPEHEIQPFLDDPYDNSPTTLLEIKYEKLKRLVRRPAHRRMTADPVAECHDNYKQAFEYHNLERRVCQSSDAFRTTSGPILDKSLVGGVDVDRCVLQGLIPASGDVNRVLTPEEQNKVFTFDNFDNLSLPARYLILKECVAQIEELIEATSSEELKEKDDNGRTIADICNIFRRLVRALENVIGGSGERPVQTDLREHCEDYVKYKYDASQLARVEEAFNEADWTDNEHKEDDKADVEASEDSTDIDSDQD